MPSTKTAPLTTAAQLQTRITREYDQLSRQLKLIARFVEKQRERIGIMGIQELARECGVQPSAVVRFAKHFGFSGFTPMQALFRAGLSRRISPHSGYAARIREVIESGPKRLGNVQIAREFLTGSMIGVEELRDHLDAKSFDKAVKLLLDADCVWVVGSRRSFPVAAYLEYALHHTDKRVGLLHNLGAMQVGQLRSIRKGDALIAISFTPYAEETQAAMRLAHDRGAHIVLISDSRMGPLAPLAEACLVVEDHATFGFRALTAAMSLAQSLFIALAYRLELRYKPSQHNNDVLDQV